MLDEVLPNMKVQTRCMAILVIVSWFCMLDHVILAGSGGSFCLKMKFGLLLQGMIHWACLSLALLMAPDAQISNSHLTLEVRGQSLVVSSYTWIYI